MMIPSIRKLGAAALIIAGISAFLVPFLLHSPTTQGTSSNNNNGGTNPNNGSHTTPPTTTTPSTTTPGTGDDKGSGGSDEGSGSTTTCTGDNSSHSDAPDKTDKTSSTDSDSSVSDDAKDTSVSSSIIHGHAYGLLKNQLDTTVALVKSMGTHNVAFHSHHDTKTDNDTVKVHNASSESSKDNDSSCAETEETNDD